MLADTYLKAAKSMQQAEKSGFETIAAPALGTGIIGDLTPEQSAAAMLSAFYHYASEGGKVN